MTKTVFIIYVLNHYTISHFTDACCESLLHSVLLLLFTALHLTPPHSTLETAKEKTMLQSLFIA